MERDFSMEQSRLGRCHGNAYRKAARKFLCPILATSTRLLSAGSRDSDPTERGFALPFELVNLSETIWLPTPPVPRFTMRDPEQGHITRWNGSWVPLLGRPGIPLLVVEHISCLVIKGTELCLPLKKRDFVTSKVVRRAKPSGVAKKHYISGCVVRLGHAQSHEY